MDEYELFNLTKEQMYKLAGNGTRSYQKASEESRRKMSEAAKLRWKKLRQGKQEKQKKS